MLNLIYGVLNVQILSNVFFDISFQTQLFHAVLWSIVGVQIYKFLLSWTLQDQEKAQAVFNEKLQKLTELGSLPECIFKKHIIPQFIEAITLKNIPHTIAFIIASNLILSYLSLFFESRAVRFVSINLAYGLYKHYNGNPDLYNSAIGKVTKLASEKFNVINSRLQKQQY